MFTIIDLFQFYWQIKKKESSKEMATFICKYGAYQLEVMPFGLKNSGETIQRMIDNILTNTENVKCYVDDDVVHSATQEEHIAYLCKAMSLLKKHGLPLRLKKCFLMQPRV